MGSQVLDDIGYEDVPWVGDIAKPASEIDRRSVEVVVVVDRFTGGYSGPDTELGFPANGVPLVESVPDRQRASQGTIRGGEGCHDPVSGVLDLPSPRCFQSASDDQVVLGQQVDENRISNFLCYRR